jgi:prevent-host-death family protein
MIDLTQDVHSMTAFKRDIPGFLERMQKSGRPLVLTKNGRADFVVLTAAEFQRLWDLADRMETLLAVRRGIDDVEAGRTRPFEEAFDELFEKHGIQRSDDRRSGT